jgi:hypothetical protein
VARTGGSFSGPDPNGLYCHIRFLDSNEGMSEMNNESTFLVLTHIVTLQVYKCTYHWVLQVMFPSACSCIVLGFTVFLNMFQPTWPSSGVYGILFSYA